MDFAYKFGNEIIHYDTQKNNYSFKELINPFGCNKFIMSYIIVYLLSVFVAKLITRRLKNIYNSLSLLPPNQ